MTDLATLDTLTSELKASGGAVDAERAQSALTQASGIAIDYCQTDLTALDPMPQTITRSVLDLATAIYRGAGRDPAVIQEECQGVGSSQWGTTGWSDLLTPLDRFRVYQIG